MASEEIVSSYLIHRAWRPIGIALDSCNAPSIDTRWINIVEASFMDLIDPTHIPRAPGTRATDPLLTVRIEGDCERCQNRHAIVSRGCFMVFYAALPFECSHHLPIRRLFVEAPEEETVWRTNIS